METAQSRRPGQGSQAGGVFGGVDCPARRSDFAQVFVEDRNPVGLAPLARSEAGPLGFLRRGVKSNILAVRPAGRAARPAIDTSGLDGVNEFPIRVWVPAKHSAPAIFVAGVPLRGLRLARHCCHVYSIAAGPKEKLQFLLSNSSCPQPQPSSVRKRRRAARV